MKKLLIIIIIILSLAMPLVATETEGMSIHYILRDNGYDLDSKSYNGWLRIFNNQENLYAYELSHLSKNEVNSCILQLIKMKNNKIVGKLK